MRTCSNVLEVYKAGWDKHGLFPASVAARQLLFRSMSTCMPLPSVHLQLIPASKTYKIGRLDKPVSLKSFQPFSLNISFAMIRPFFVI
ncbi:hypothetical protein J6590_051489 [Homalodisca vitripennis]|nr:hypothetical protein J6590_051489 [Homalodisca vitripennis]